MTDLSSADLLNTDLLRRDFPILSQKIRNKPFVFLDSAASAQKPSAVINAMKNMAETCYANVYRGLYLMSEQTTQHYEEARETVARFLHARSSEEVIFVRNTTEAINLVARSLSTLWNKGDAVVISEAEHHANIIPWQMLREAGQIELRFIPLTEEKTFDLEAYARLLADKKVKLVSITHLSNVLGYAPPVEKMIAMAREAGAKILLDGAQAVVHLPDIDVQALDIDFYAFSGHKLYGPTGIGVLWGRKALLDAMPPFLGGGEMIEEVTKEKVIFSPIPHKFEAGTPAIIEAVGLKAAIDYIEAVGRDKISRHISRLTEEAVPKLRAIPGLEILGSTNPQEHHGVISFDIKGTHPHDIATLLDQQGIAVRAGQHCAHVLLKRFGLPATVRASFALYNTPEEVDILTAGLRHVCKILL